MKILYFFLLVLFINLSANSQNCTTPVSKVVFQQKINQLTTIKQEQQKLNIANEFVRRNCLLSSQIKKIAEMFRDDATRLTFIENAYPALVDVENNYDLYDAFTHFSTAMRLHDYLESLNRDRDDDDYDSPGSFPEYNYPSYENYHDNTPCSRPISDEVFYRLIRKIRSYRDDDSRIIAAYQIVESNCLTVAQIMKLGSLLDKENKRLDYLKHSYDYSYDNGNYQYSNQLFKDKTFSSDFDNFMREKKSHSARDDRRRNTEREPCRISEQDLQEIISTIKNQPFDNTQLSTTKQIVQAKQCFTTLQIKQLVEIFKFENSRLEIAKYCYAYCTDKTDYYKINNSFTFSTSVDDLNKFINAQNK